MEQLYQILVISSSSTLKTVLYFWYFSLQIILIHKEDSIPFSVFSLVLTEENCILVSAMNQYEVQKEKTNVKPDQNEGTFPLIPQVLLYTLSGLISELVGDVLMSHIG